MKFRTEIEINKSPNKINPNSSLFFIGSCFATNIGNECSNRGIKTYINPFGVTYNPLSIAKIIEIIDNNSNIDEKYFRKVGDKWCSMLHHSDFNNSNLDTLKESINSTITQTRNYILSSSHIFITLGTAWVYFDKKEGYVVNNCHKIAEKEFIRKRISIDEIIESLSGIIENTTLLKGKKFVFTLSPIRHIRDGLQGNSISKATLRSAIEILCEMYPDRVEYFPSYEIMIDDLRDYRFYEADMIHPSTTAIQYIYSVFENCFLSEQAIEYGKQMYKLNRAMQHRVIDSTSDAYIEFKKRCYNDLIKVKERFNNGNYDELFDYFKQSI